VACALVRCARDDAAIDDAALYNAARNAVTIVALRVTARVE
jgi:hypothetical protein